MNECKNSFFSSLKKIEPCDIVFRRLYTYHHKDLWENVWLPLHGLLWASFQNMVNSLHIKKLHLFFQTHTHLIFFSRMPFLRKPCAACLFCFCNYTHKTEKLYLSKQCLVFSLLFLSFISFSVLHFLLLGKFTCQGDLLLVPYFCIIQFWERQFCSKHYLTDLLLPL